MNVIHPVLIRIPFQPGIAGPQIIARQREYARIALQHSGGLIGASEGDWPMTAERAPLPRDGFHWSIAHKPRFAAAVVARAPVGIDIEAITPRGRDLSPAVASDEEWNLISPPQPRHSERSEESRRPCHSEPAAAGKLREESRPPRNSSVGQNEAQQASVNWLTFFQMWTAKEAVLKANGKGIGGLKACRLESVTQAGQFALRFEGRTCRVEHFPYAAHISACTCDGSRLLWHAIDGPTSR